MIRIWLFAEAPLEFRTFAGLDEVMAGKTPLWLAHRMEVNGLDADILRALTAAWVDRSPLSRDVYTCAMGVSGVLTVGMLTIGSACTEESKP